MSAKRGQGVPLCQMRTASERELDIASAQLGMAQSLCDDPQAYTADEAREILDGAEHALSLARRALGLM